jgi:hypothetical protein
LLFACGLSAQQPARALKPFTPPPEDKGADNPLVAHNLGCARDMVKAIRMEEGLEQQRFIHDLVVYGCVQLVEGNYGAVTMQVETIDKTPFRKVRLVGGTPPTVLVIEGWVPLTNGGWAEVVETIRREQSKK